MKSYIMDEILKRSVF